MYYFWRLVAIPSLGYVAVFYMIFVHGLRPTVKSAVKAYVSLIALAAVAYCANSLISPDTNYLFMAKPEDTPSILDIPPPNHALRIAVMAAVVTLMFALAYLLWYLMDRKAKKARVPAA